MTTPTRLRLSRTKGFDLQEHSLATNGLPAAKVDRATIFGNPFVRHSWGEPMSPALAVTSFRRLIEADGSWFPQPVHTWPKGQIPARMTTLDDVRTLRGKNLACWCALDAPCHADILLELANRPTCDEVPS